MTKLTKILFGFAGLFLAISILVGWWESRTDDFGALAAIPTGLVFVIVLAIALGRLMSLESSKTNPLGRQHKKLDKYLAYGLLLVTLIVAALAITQNN